ncbi:MAG: hypothetical protein M3O31_10605, partial [Acidobacteriota bacterium]|nr:hypothetical protein [Acidobacteriota bacterium]
MQTINYRRVLLGGLLASLVLLVGEIAMIACLHTRLMAAREAAKLPTTVPNPILAITELLLSGLFVVWLYAAVRPRFGAGWVTAVRSGAAAWFAIVLLTTIHMVNDNFGMPAYLLIGIGVWMLPCLVAASLAGGWVYRE